MADEKKGRSHDDFWDLESLLPQKKKTPVAPPRVRDTAAVEITQGAQARRSSGMEDVLFTEHPVHPVATTQAPPKKPLYAYSPQNTLLHEVRVYAWRTQYDYYEVFRRQAVRLLDEEGRECPAVDFFSYMPQYSQMSDAQLRYYLWWRSNFRRGHVLPAAFSYLLLYLYELINLGDEMDPAQGQAHMTRLWLSYRAEHPRLDALVREWLCDYSLLYRLPPPALPRALYRELLSGCKLKEFYVPLDEEGDALRTAVLLFCNNYDYTKSKFYTEESASDYHRVLRGAVGVALRELRTRDGNQLTGEGGISTVCRDTFVGAICSYRRRRRIEIEYTSFSHTHELRYIMSDVLKYAENALRAARGIKSRLGIYALDVPLRQALDAYLLQIVPKRVAKSVKKEAQMHDYERRYERPAVTPSPERAAQIERQSWQTTRTLVEAFEEEMPPSVSSAPTLEAVRCEPPKKEEPLPLDAGEAEGDLSLAAALGTLCNFVQLCAQGNAAAQRAYASAQGMMIDAIVDKINTVSGDILGDIILEESDSGFAVIEEYRELLAEQGVL